MNVEKWFSQPKSQQSRFEILSKFFTKMLRHSPSEFGLSMDDNNFCDLEKFYQAVEEHSFIPASRGEISYVLLNSKWCEIHRFDVYKGKVRATYKHTYLKEG